MTLHSSLDIYKKFHSDQNKETLQIIERWQNGESDTMLLENKPLHGVLTHGQPLFQCLNLSKSFAEGGTLICQSENCVALIPAGFRKAPTLNKMNPIKHSLGGLSALMALAHVIIVPKTKRIYNALTLKISDLSLVSEMEELGSLALQKLIYGTANDPGSLRWNLAQNGSITDIEGQDHSLTIEAEDMSESCREEFQRFLDPSHFDEVLERSEASMKFSFHLGDQASIGYLHMHAYLGNLLTLAHDKMEAKARESGSVKNTPLDEIIYLMNRQ